MSSALWSFWTDTMLFVVTIMILLHLWLLTMWIVNNDIVMYIELIVHIYYTYFYPSLWIRSWLLINNLAWDHSTHMHKLVKRVIMLLRMMASNLSPAICISFLSLSLRTWLDLRPLHTWVWALRILGHVIGSPRRFKHFLENLTLGNVILLGN